MKSFIYWHPRIYDIVMRFLHGKEYLKRHMIIAKEIGDMRILDLCCGHCKLADYLNNYRGIDSNEVFVKNARKRGLNVINQDILKSEIPKSECIVMQESLYQFIPHHEEMITRMLEKAKKVIIFESGVHLTQSKNPLIALVSKRLTNTTKAHEHRFTKRQLLHLYKKFHAKKIIDSGKGMIGIFEK